MRVFFSVDTTRTSVTQFVCSDDRCDDDDYQEANAVPPQSVLDVYRQAATSGRSGSHGQDVLGQLTA